MSAPVSLSSRHLLAFFASLIVLGAAGQQSHGQALDRPAAKEGDRARRLAEMRQIAGSFQAVVIDGDTRAPAAMAGDPLYRWNDPTREFSDGTLWFWKSSGRPIAVVAIELYPQNSRKSTRSA